MKHFAKYVAIALLVGATVAYGAEEKQRVGARIAHKWARGLANTFTGIVEIPVQTVKGWKRGVNGLEERSTTSKVCGGAIGICKGVYHGVGRTVWGVYEAVTFWSVDPEDNVGHGLPLDSEFAWEIENQEPFFANREVEYAAPMGRKLRRGAENFFLGVTALPYHVGQEARDPEGRVVVEGICQGLWHFISREVDGVAEIITFFLPQPEETVGAYFPEPKPWNHLSSGN